LSTTTVTASTSRLAISEVSIACEPQNEPIKKSDAAARARTTTPSAAAICRRRALSIAPHTTLGG